MKVTAQARRSGDWWAITVPEVEGVFSQARRLDQVALQAADAVATMLDIEPADVEVTVVPDVANEATAAAVAAALEASQAATAAAAVASSSTRAAVARLQGAGYSTRDVAALLGISHQRVSQLAATSAP